MTPSVSLAFAERVKLRLPSGSWTWVPLVFLTYALLFDNANSIPTAQGADWTQLLLLPREVRIVEAVCLFLALLVLLDRRMSRVSRYLLLALAVFTALAVTAQIMNPLASLLNAFRLIYSYVSPIIVFIIGREARLNERSRSFVVRMMFGWIILCAAVSWYQFVWLGYPLGDNITALNKDAHANGNLLLFASLILTAQALFLRKRKLFLLTIGLVVTAVLSSVLKSEIFTFIAMALIVWVNISNPATSFGLKIRAGIRKRIVPITALVLVVIAMGLAFSDLDSFNNARAGDVITRIREEPLQFGPIASHLNALDFVWETPRTFLFGQGPYSYANPVSVGQGLAAGELGKYARSSLLLEYGESTESAKVTQTSGVFAELGFPALVVLLAAYLTIGWAVWRERTSSNPEQVAYATSLTGCWLILMLTAIVTLSGSFDTISIAWPVMFLAGITCRIGSPKEGSAPESRGSAQ